MLHQILTVFAPLLAFMLVPLWIPVVAIALGWVSDRVFPRPPSPVRAAVEAAVARTRDARQLDSGAASPEPTRASRPRDTAPTPRPPSPRTVRPLEPGS
jgi:hypothetical protein